MSLINKMLKDLETRDGAASSKTATPAYEDLRAVRYTHSRSSSLRTVLLLALLVVALGVGGFYFFGGTLLQDKSSVVASAPLTLAPAPEPQSVATVQTSESSPTTEATAVNQKSSPPAVTVTKVAPKPVIGIVARPATSAKTVAASKIVAQDATSSDKAVVEKRERAVEPMEDAETRYREAAQYIAQGRSEDARATLAAALATYPVHRKARELAAGLALQNGRLREAQDLLTQGLKLAPDHLPFAQMLARIYLEQGSEAQAIATLEGVRGAGSADYFSLLAALYQRAGQHADAVKAYRDTVTLRAQDARAWLGLGISLDALQDTGAAAEAYSRALALGSLDAKLAQYAQQRLAATKK